MKRNLVCKAAHVETEARRRCELIPDKTQRGHPVAHTRETARVDNDRCEIRRDAHRVAGGERVNGRDGRRHAGTAARDDSRAGRKSVSLARYRTPGQRAGPAGVDDRWRRLEHATSAAVGLLKPEETAL